MIAASFGAWQGLGAHIQKLPAWSKYIRDLGLSDEPELTKEDLQREASHSMSNVQKIIDKARGVNVSG